MLRFATKRNRSDPPDPGWVHHSEHLLCKVTEALFIAITGWLVAGCGTLPGRLLPNESTEPVDPRFTLVARFAHLTDSHVVDEESPGRLAGGAAVTRSAWRPQEVFSTQLLDGMVRTVNKIHVARKHIDFLVFTGDACDNAQQNELHWFLTAMDGGRIDPRSGPDDRDPAQRPPPLLDPHHPFQAQGLYRRGVHGEAPTIPWYAVLGNHDHFAVGVFAIVTNFFGNRVAPLPLPDRLGVFFPVELNPTGTLTGALITPAHPGPPAELNLPATIEANPARRYLTNGEFVRASLESPGEPPGHGFTAADPTRTWYSVAPVPGVRLIGLNSASPFFEQPRLVFSEGAISLPQVRFLTAELEKAQSRGEWVIVATHHPSEAIPAGGGSAISASSFVALLNRFPCVKLHVAGHLHQNLVIDHGGYTEIVTSSIIDAPQQGRIIEIWRDGEEMVLRYELFSHWEEITPPADADAALFEDPLLPMRRVAAQRAGVALP